MLIDAITDRESREEHLRGDTPRAWAALVSPWFGQVRYLSLRDAG
jgi:hypothetical protein